jgi:hypothetical protein
MNQDVTKEELFNLLRRMNQNFFVSDVVALFAFSRTLIEAQNAQMRWKRLWFYSNWILHPKLDLGHKDIHRFLFETISKAINEHYGNNEIITKQITDAVGLPALRTEMEEFFQTMNAPKEIGSIQITDSGDFLGTTAFCVSHRPILNENKSKVGRLNLKSEISDDVYIHKVELVEIDRNAFLAIYISPPPPRMPTGQPFMICQINSEN